LFLYRLAMLMETLFNVFGLMHEVVLLNKILDICPPSLLLANSVLYSICTIKISDSIIGTMYVVTFIVCFFSQHWHEIDSYFSIIQLEDFINLASISSLSSVSVQFIVKVIILPFCSTTPETTIIEQSCIFRRFLIKVTYKVKILKKNILLNKVYVKGKTKSMIRCSCWTNYILLGKMLLWMKRKTFE
jgi:hypothetical protein